MMKNVIDAIHIPDVAKLVRPAKPSDDRRQPPQRRRPQDQPRRDDVPNPKVYAPDGHVEEPEVTHIDLVG